MITARECLTENNFTLVPVFSSQHNLHSSEQQTDCETDYGTQYIDGRSTVICSVS